MEIFVTGGSGFLGKNLVGKLKADGHRVTAPTSASCNLEESRSLGEFSRVKYDRVYHLAAWTQAGDFCLRHPGEQWIKNQLINTNVLSWWSQYQPQSKLIFMGTSCVYDPDERLVEENFCKGVPTESLYTYAMTKRMLYVGACALQKQFGLNWMCFVPSTLYGPSYHTDGRQMHFIFDLIVKIIRGKLFDEPVVLWGDGYQVRELVHVDDFTSIMLRLSGLNNEIINIGDGKGHTIREFADIICELVDYDPRRITYDTARYVGAKSKVLDNTKASKYLGDYDYVSLREGIETVVSWFLETKSYV
jgi:GDP-L-fucose synthase